MVDRRGSRFVIEAVFLVALAAALAFARVSVLEIAGAMILGWIVVAAFEWAAWRGEPHYGSGMPPRYYVPSLNLPPAQPLEQLDQGYPDASREEAPTWIASAALRAELLGEWPVAAPPSEDDAEEEEEPEFVHSSEAGADPWTVAALPAEPIVVPEPQPRAPSPSPSPEPEPEPAAVATAPRPTPQRTARHHLDPLGESSSRRRFGRGRALDVDVVELPARPSGARPLPRSATKG
jgi:hypothetical protein